MGLLHITRDIFGPTATLSRCTIDGKDFAFGCEDIDRGLYQGMPLADLQAIKVLKETAIGIGRFRLARTWSNRYGRVMLHILDVDGYRGIRIHPGNTQADTWGCYLAGTQRNVGAMTVSHSVAACQWLEAEVARRHKEIWEVLIDRDEEAWATAPGRRAA